MYGVFGSSEAINDYFGRSVMNLTVHSCGLSRSEVSPSDYAAAVPGIGTLVMTQTPEAIHYKFITGHGEDARLIEGGVDLKTLGIQTRRNEDPSYQPLSEADWILLSDYIYKAHGLSPDDHQIKADLEKRTPFLATPHEMQHLLDQWLASDPSLYVQGMPDARVLKVIALGEFPLLKDEEELSQLGRAPANEFSFAYLNAHQELCGFALYWREDMGQWAILHSANANAAPEARRNAVVVSTVTPDATNHAHQLEPIGGLDALERLRAEIGPAPLVRLFLDQLFNEDNAVRKEIVDQWSRMRVFSVTDTASGKLWTQAQTQDFTGFQEGVRSLFGNSAGTSCSSSSASTSAPSSSVSGVEVPLDGSQSAMLCRMGLQKLGHAEKFETLGTNNHADWAYLLHARRFARILPDLLAMDDIAQRNDRAAILASSDTVTSETLLNLHAVGVSISELRMAQRFFSVSVKKGISESLSEQRRQVLQFLAAHQCRLDRCLEPSAFALLYQLLSTLRDIGEYASGQVWLKNNLVPIYRYALSEDKQKGLQTLLEAFFIHPSENKATGAPNEPVAPEFVSIGNTVFAALLVAKNTDSTFSRHQGQVAAFAFRWLESQNMPYNRQIAHTIIAGTPAGIQTIPVATLRALLRFPQMSTEAFSCLCRNEALSSVLLNVSEDIEENAQIELFNAVSQYRPAIVNALTSKTLALATNANCTQLIRTIIAGTPENIRVIPTAALKLLARFPVMSSMQFRHLCENQSLAQGLVRLTGNVDQNMRQYYFNALMAVPVTRKEAVGRALNDAAEALDAGCHRIRNRLVGLSDAAATKLHDFDQNVAAFKGLMHVAIVTRLTAPGAPEALNAAFTHALEQAEEQFDRVLNVDRAPWLRRALNAISWAVAVAVSIACPPLGLWVAAAMQSHHEKTGDIGFFSRTESSAMAHETNRNMKRILEQALPDTLVTDNTPVP